MPEYIPPYEATLINGQPAYTVIPGWENAEFAARLAIAYALQTNALCIETLKSLPVDQGIKLVHEAIQKVNIAN